MICFLHAPLGTLWLFAGVMAIAGIVSLFIAPQRTPHLAELVVTVVACVKLVARVT